MNAEDASAEEEAEEEEEVVEAAVEIETAAARATAAVSGATRPTCPTATAARDSSALALTLSTPPPLSSSLSRASSRTHVVDNSASELARNFAYECTPTINRVQGWRLR